MRDKAEKLLHGAARSVELQKADAVRRCSSSRIPSKNIGLYSVSSLQVFSHRSTVEVAIYSSCPSKATTSSYPSSYRKDSPRSSLQRWPLPRLHSTRPEEKWHPPHSRPPQQAVLPTAPRHVPKQDQNGMVFYICFFCVLRLQAGPLSWRA